MPTPEAAILREIFAELHLTAEDVHQVADVFYPTGDPEADRIGNDPATAVECGRIRSALRTIADMIEVPGYDC
jgi:hypothetical protein